ncbi:syntaphilin isoform X1 [Nomascus leucogenys]|uniref:syntaphilin isoform X1 n=2 Tax=Nomascus leucogenys TaxID=61853 RepID=UPI00122D7C51|nr:syntaphilin isoform X1 [Nomascus leucogenys]XP_030682480.1 syntaphilin isoform X1 [Nomascus leucogenys]XP_030682481.1 syntaphilin isoform X1 [Nomascus leucogenys]XP_030682482.1 syntaphilin isoform X1 [Nomascus leucogenys]
MPGSGPSERMTWPGPAFSAGPPTRPLSSAPGIPPIPPLTRTRSLMAMSLPGSRRTSAGSRSGGTLGRSGLAVFAQCPQLPASQNEHLPLLPASRRTSPPVSVRDAYGTSSLSSSSNSGSYKGSDSSPTPRRSIKYTLCSDNHGIKPPTPEQYLTPLQQKEVCIRHLKARLKDTQDRLQDRDTEIDDLKTQLSRMQEDWIEEECHRVEAQLALKEARKEIKQLKQVIDTVKNNLIDKDKGLQKYFVDINIQNKKLETLLHSMEVAQNGMAKEDGTGESAGGSPARSLTRSSTYTKLSDPAVCGDRQPGDPSSGSAEDGADSGFAAADDTLSRTDVLEASSLLSSGLDCGTEETSLHSSFGLGPRFPASNTYEKLLCGMEAGVQASCMQERAIQTDFVQYQPDLDTILEKVNQAQVCGTDPESGDRCPELDAHPPGPRDPNSAVVVTVGDELEAPEPITRGPTPQRPGANPNPGQSVSVVCPMEEEEEEAAVAEKEPKSYWSRHYIVDLLAVVVPAVPTVAWLCRSQRRQGQPIYNISSLLRGCCTVALHSIRRISCRSLSQPSPSPAGSGSQL